MNEAGRELRTLLDAGVIGALSDGHLLDRFIEAREEAVFEMIVRRHGPMVLRVCRRILHDHHDADDAFQATFFVLVRRAGAIRPRENLGRWLYGVAQRTAVKARATRRKRSERESPTPHPPESARAHERRADDLLEQLDSEIRRLPEKYGLPIVLCELEGLSHKEAAERLGWPIGTVSGRLSRARAMLTKRVSRSGVGGAIGILASLSAAHSASGCMPAGLVSHTVRAVCAAARFQATNVTPVSPNIQRLAEEVMKQMLWSKVRVVPVALCLFGVLAAGSVLLAQRTSNERAAPVQPRPTASPAVRDIIKQRYDTARAVFEQGMARHANGMALDAMDLAAWSRRWMEDETNLSDAPAATLAAIQSHLDRTKRLESIADQYANSGQGTSADALKVRYFRLEAEQFLIETRARYPQLRAPTPAARGRADKPADTNSPPPPPPPPK